jgi:hypothetical protein
MASAAMPLPAERKDSIFHQVRVSMASAAMPLPGMRKFLAMPTKVSMASAAMPLPEDMYAVFSALKVGLNGLCGHAAAGAVLHSLRYSVACKRLCSNLGSPREQVGQRWAGVGRCWQKSQGSQICRSDCSYQYFRARISSYSQSEYSGPAVSAPGGAGGCCECHRNTTAGGMPGVAVPSAPERAKPS